MTTKAYHLAVFVCIQGLLKRQDVSRLASHMNIDAAYLYELWLGRPGGVGALPRGGGGSKIQKIPIYGILLVIEGASGPGAPY